ncbi:permease prefix domain 1-containing protein [Salinispira pacifica]|uniref:Membrane protein, putative n=1 Tax=Salinispira pacifica TaxID=1307761 RepID=V5WM59_9SPIO|nr:permease prefix domain 1-containing protein [Salinispira pacifica]AHC16728.1 membrane protein, putative [Salinispira pacifica]
MNIRDEIQLWLGEIAHRSDLNQEDQVEMEAHLLDSAEELMAAGLREDEAYLIALRRFGNSHDIILAQHERSTRRLWKQLYRGEDESQDADGKSVLRRENILTAALVFLSGVLALIPGMLGKGLSSGSPLYFMNAGFFIIPILGIYYPARRRIRGEQIGKTWLLPLVLMLLPMAVNLYPFQKWGQTQVIAILHLPLAQWLVLALFRNPRCLYDPRDRLDFIRFSGETAVYSVLVGLSGLLLVLLSAGLFSVIGVDIEAVLEQFIVPLLLPVTLFLGTILAERKKSLVENFAPILARLVSPPLLLVLLLFTAFFLSSTDVLEADRELLIIMDIMLLAVIVVVIYSVSVRSELRKDPFQDWINFLIVICALLLNLIVLSSMVYRLAEYGVSANKITSLGSNVLLTGNLSVLLLYFLRKIRNGVPGTGLLSIQGSYFAVYYGWFLILIMGFPLIFGFA